MMLVELSQLMPTVRPLRKTTSCKQIAMKHRQRKKLELLTFVVVGVIWSVSTCYLLSLHIRGCTPSIDAMLLNGNKGAHRAHTGTKKLVGVFNGPSFNLELFRHLSRKKGFDVVMLKESTPLAMQMDVDVVLHRVLPQTAVHKYDRNSIAAENYLEKYIKSHPGVIVLDPLDSVRNLASRSRLFHIASECQFNTKDTKVYVPNFIEISSSSPKHNLQTIREGGVKFPLLCKPVSVAITAVGKSHKIDLILNESGLEDVTVPCVAQSFVNHDAVLYKVYVVGNKHHIIKRKSLDNLDNNKSRHSSVSINFSQFLKRSKPAMNYKENMDSLNSTVVAQLVTKLRNKLGVSLFGVDIIIEKGTGNHVIIDINYFTGYGKVPNYMVDLIDHFSSVFQKKYEDSQ